MIVVVLSCGRPCAGPPPTPPAASCLLDVPCGYASRPRILAINAARGATSRHHRTDQPRDPLYQTTPHRVNGLKCPESLVRVCLEAVFGPVRGRICHRPVAYWWVTAKHRWSVFGYRPDRVGFMLSTRPSLRVRRDAFRRRGGGGWGWDPLEETARAVFAVSAPGARCVLSGAGTLSEVRHRKLAGARTDARPANAG